MKRLYIVPVVAIVLASSAHPQGSTPRPPSSGVIRSETKLVLVDTLVTDRKGNHVRDLTEKDFRIYEDGKEQKVAAFSLESGGADPSHKQHIVFFFDDTIVMPAQAYARQATAKFIESNVGPNRLMAVAEFSDALQVTQNFTDDAEKLKAAVSASKLSALTGTRLPAATGQVGRGAGSQDNFAVRRVLDSVRTLVQGMAGLTGRKALVFVSGGFPSTTQSQQELKETISTCNYSDVAVYTIGWAAEVTPSGSDASSNQADLSGRGGGSARGNVGNAGRGPAAGPMEDLPTDNTPAGLQQSLVSLANGTGGFAIVNTNNVSAGFERIAKDQESYYLLGFVPSEDSVPGSCHTLKVKVDRGGETIRAREGYCQDKPLDILSGTSAERDLETRIAANATPTVTGATMTAPFFYTAADIARVRVALEVPAGAMEFVRDKGKFHAVMNVIGVAVLADGTVRGRFSDSVQLVFNDKKELDQFNARPFLYEKQFPIGPGSYTLKVAFSSGGKKFGKLETPLAIDHWEPKQFAISGIALSRSIRPAKDGASSLGVELADYRAPLVVNGMEVLATGSNIFKKSERAFIYAEIYEPARMDAALKLAVAPSLGVHVELVDAAGKTRKDFGVMEPHLPETADSPVVPVGLIVTAPELDAGDYTLRLTAVDSEGRQSSRVVVMRFEN